MERALTTTYFGETSKAEF